MPTRSGYTLIAVNMGLGKWVYYDANSTNRTATHYWASSGSTRYNFISAAIHMNGVNATNYILQNTADSTSTTLFNVLASTRTSTGITGLYVPSHYELLEVQSVLCDNTHASASSCSYSKNIGTMFSISSSAKYWTSGQYPSIYGSAFYINFADGRATYFNKDTAYRKLFLIHF